MPEGSRRYFTPERVMEALRDGGATTALIAEAEGALYYRDERVDAVLDRKRVSPRLWMRGSR